MIRKEFESLAEYYERFNKVSSPLQEKIIECSTATLNALEEYVNSGKDPKEEAKIIDFLDKWREALEEFEKSKK